MPMMSNKDHPLARQLAAEWAELDPAAIFICSKCIKRFPIVGPSGPNVACPYCGQSPSESDCRKFLTGLNRRRLKGELAAAMIEVLGEAAGSKPSVVRIQCRCSDCGAASEAPPYKAGKEEICPECGRKLTAADRLASELIAFNADATTLCRRCKTPFAIMRSGMTCPQCGGAPLEEICDDTLEYIRERMGDCRKFKRLNELLNGDSAGRKVPRFGCPFCRFELPSSLAELNFARVACPHCKHADLYVYNAEAFQSPRDCERILKFRLEKRSKAKEKARERELTEAAKELGAETQVDRGQANGGYVYALLNLTMPGLVKIGKTQREPDGRAKELSAGTGVPTPFVVAHEEWFKDCSVAEDYVHALLEEKGFRVAQNREFFSAPLKAAIQAIMKAKEREDRSDSLLSETGAEE